MMKYYIIFLIINCLYSSLADANNISLKILNRRSDKKTVYHLLVTFFKTCNFQAKKIIICDSRYTRESFAAIIETQPQVSTSLFNDRDKWRWMDGHQIDNLEVDIVIVTIRSRSTWDDMQDIFKHWHYNRDCTIYIFPQPLNDCANYKNILILIMRFYFPKAYFICLGNDKIIYVYTHDPYGDSKPPYWKKKSQSLLWGKNWTFYERSHHAYSNLSQLCRGFNFERTDPNSQEFVVFGFPNKVIKKKEYRKTADQLNNTEIERLLVFPHKEVITSLRKLLKYKFAYSMIKLQNKQESILMAAKNSDVDGLIRYKIMGSYNYTFITFYPVIYEHTGIISHNRGLMTPLEKITKFYGKWTLSSLIVILIIAFTVMWFSTKKLSLTTFNVVRLLINTEIITPMNTWRLKMFFSMIFLYFLIIHATFSGHLAEFLTKVEYRPNIDTIEQLNDPTIKKILTFSYRYDTSKDLDIIRQKSKNIDRAAHCRKMNRRLNYVCIAPIMILNDVFLRENASSTLYISKNTFGIKIAGYFYRQGFPLREKFDWAFLYLFDTTIISQWITAKHLSVLRKIEERAALNHVEYRPIIVRDLSFAFTLLIIGNCIGFICFLLEITFKNYCSKFITHNIKRTNVVSIEVQSR